MDIEKQLKEYKIKKATVETTLARIEQWKWAMQHPEEWYKDYIPNSSSVLGMPGRPHGSPAAPTEDFLIDKELNANIIESWIKTEQSRIFMLNMEVEQIDIAIRSLTDQQQYIIKAKYFDELFWKDIETSFNEKFRQKNYVTQARLKQIKDEAINKLIEVLLPFYEYYKIA